MPANYQQSKPAGGRPIVLIVLLVVALAFVVLYAREDESGPIHQVQARIQSVVAPASSLGAHAGAAIGGVGTAIGDATADAETLSALREQNAQLRRMVADAEEYRQEVERLQGLLDMKRVSNVKGKIARVIGSSATAWDQSITVDVGSAEGAQPGMTVMGSTGVIGQIAQVMDHSSVVRLLTDPNSGAAVKIQSSRANAIVRGSLDGRLHLEDVEGDEIPEVGDVVITSGLGGSYQSGLIVGTVTSVKRTANNSSGDIIVNPNASAALLEEVIVVMDDAALEAVGDEDGDELGTVVADAEGATISAVVIGAVNDTIQTVYTVEAYRESEGSAEEAPAQEGSESNEGGEYEGSYDE